MPSGTKTSGKKVEVILRLKLQGLTYKQIAPQVGLHWVTVERIVRKAGGINEQARL